MMVINPFCYKSETAAGWSFYSDGFVVEISRKIKRTLEQERFEQ
jgi:hypothetical protein